MYKGGTTRGTSRVPLNPLRQAMGDSLCSVQALLLTVYSSLCLICRPYFLLFYSSLYSICWPYMPSLRSIYWPYFSLFILRFAQYTPRFARFAGLTSHCFILRFAQYIPRFARFAGLFFLILNSYIEIF